MKKYLALFLALLMVCCTLASCAPRDEEDKGAIINMYLTQEIRYFDPLYVYTNAASVEYDATTESFQSKLYANAEAVEILGLLYEGLTRINANGKVEYALAKKVKITEEPDEDLYMMTIELDDTCWSDGVAVQADDFLYTVRRVLDCGITCEGASLLFDIKNAKAVKAGDVTIDDLGISAPDNKTIEITFEESIDYDQFLENLASPLLVPLREDKVEKPLVDEETDEVIYGADGMSAKNRDWATTATNLICSGPFFIRNMESETGDRIVLERNKYYYLDKEKNERLTKYVNPYKIVLHYDWTLEEAIAAFNDGTLFYLGQLPVAEIANYKDQLITQDQMASFAYAFNPKSELLANPKVREALSLALDRTYIASLQGLNVPATGFVPHGVYDTGFGTSFRDQYGTVIETSANIDAAKALLKEAGVSGGTITMLVRNFTQDNYEQLAAEHAKEQWEKLGFKVELDSRGRNMYQTKFSEGNYDVYATDWISSSPRAIYTVASFGVGYTGTKVDFENHNYDPHPNSTGYMSEEIATLLDEAFTFAEGSRERNDKVAEIEKILVRDMPIIPLTFYVDYYMINSGMLSKVKTSLFGYKLLHDAKLKNYHDYLGEETAADEGTGA